MRTRYARLPPNPAETAMPTTTAATVMKTGPMVGSARKVLNLIAMKDLASTATQKTGSE